MHHELRNENFAEVIDEEFAAQSFMSTIGAGLDRVEAGRVEISVPFDDTLTQQDSFLHAGIAMSIIDSACGFAALTLMPSGSRVLTVCISVNLLRPARSGLVATGEVVRSGRTITVCRGEVRSSDDDAVVAVCQATMMCVRDDR